MVIIQVSWMWYGFVIKWTVADAVSAVVAFFWTSCVHEHSCDYRNKRVMWRHSALSCKFIIYYLFYLLFNETNNKVMSWVTELRLHITRFTFSHVCLSSYFCILNLVYLFIVLTRQITKSWVESLSSVFTLHDSHFPVSVWVCISIF